MLLGSVELAMRSNFPGCTSELGRAPLCLPFSVESGRRKDAWLFSRLFDGQAGDA
jgi:hypothetical protein